MTAYTFPFTHTITHTHTPIIHSQPSALYITASLSPYTNPSNHALHTHTHTRLTSHCNSFVITLFTCVFPPIFGFDPLFFSFCVFNSYNKTIIYVSTIHYEAASDISSFLSSSGCLFSSIKAKNQ